MDHRDITRLINHKMYGWLQDMPPIGERTPFSTTYAFLRKTAKAAHPLNIMEEAIKIRNLKNNSETVVKTEEKKHPADAERGTAERLEEMNRAIEDEKSRINQMYERSRVEFVNSLSMDTPRMVFLQLPGILFACAVLSYLIGRFHLSVSLLLVLMYAMYYVFSRNVSKFKRSMGAIVFKDERRRKVCELEPVEWINFAAERVWKIIESEVSKEVFRIVNPILAEKCPSFLSQIALSEFTLGSLPPVVKGISFDPRTSQDTLSFDAEVFFVPLEVSKGAAMMCLNDSMNWNSRIVLTARLGLNVRGKGLDIPVMVRNLSFAGRARIILKLTRCVMMPVKSVDFCFLSPPQIDFDLCPLKSIDLMNLPGLSTFIRTLIDSNMQKMLIDPNSITIDLQKKGKEEVIPEGVVLLHIYSLDNRSDESCCAEIDVDGRCLFKTDKREGVRIVYNEYFYMVVNSKDEAINVNFISTAVNVSHKYGTASVSLKKLRSIGCMLQDIKIWKKGSIRAVLETDVKFYPVIHGPKVPNSHMSAQAVIVMTVHQIENIQGQKKPRNQLYNTFCQVLVCEKMADKVLKKEESMANLLSGALKTAGSLSKNIAGNLTKNIKSGFNTLTSTGQAEETEVLQGASHTTMFIGRTRRVMETRSPFFDEKFEFFSRNIRKDMLYMTIVDQHEGEDEVIGRVDIPLKDVHDGTEGYYKIKGAQQGRVKLSFSFHYIAPFISPFKRYASAVRIRINGMTTTYDEGVFYAVVKNRRESFFVDNFCYGDLPINREIIVPAEDDDHLKMYLFRENYNECDYIGEGRIELKAGMQEVDMVERGEVGGSLAIEIDIERLTGIGCKRCRAEDQTGNGKVAMSDESSVHSAAEKDRLVSPGDELSDKECVLHTGHLSDVNPHESDATSHYMRRDAVTVRQGTSSGLFHVVQVCFKHFDDVYEDFFIEFVCGDEVIKKSGLIKLRKDNKAVEDAADNDRLNVLGVYEHRMISSNCEVFTLLCGENPIKAQLRTSSFGKTRIIGECLIPKKCMDEKVSLGTRGNVQLTVCTQVAQFKWRDYFKIGYLEVRILSAARIRGVEKNNLSDPYIKVYLNNTKIHKTKTMLNTVNPTFNENFCCKVNIMTDVLRFEVIDWNRIETNQLISLVEVPLYFVVEGFTDITLHLIDALKMRKDGSCLNLAFVFNKQYKGSENVKKIAASSFV